MKRSGQINGVVSLVSFFCALCLAVFAVLTLSTANREQTLTELAEARAAAYYEADLRAVEALSAAELAEGETIELSFPQGEHLLLEVSAVREGGALRVTRWQSVYSGDWNADQSINVWTGD